MNPLRCVFLLTLILSGGFAYGQSNGTFIDNVTISSTTNGGGGHNDISLQNNQGHWLISGPAPAGTSGTLGFVWYPNPSGPHRRVMTLLNTSSGVSNLGIGNVIPNAPLQFTNDLFRRKIVLFEEANNDYQFFGFGLAPGKLKYQVSSSSSNHVFYAATAANLEDELLRITGTGQLKFPIGHSRKKITLYDYYNNNYQFYGFGLDDNTTSYHVEHVNASHVFYSGTSSSTESELMRVKGNGNVSIGGGDPLDKLHLKSGMIRIEGSNAPANSGTGNLRIGSNGSSYSWVQSNGSPLLLNPLATGSNNNYVAIGFNPATTSGRTVPAGYKLAVDGHIICTELKVKTNNWPDYVFKSDYNLMPLDSVAYFIQQHNHLPEVPSAKEVEENGINSGEMDNLMMKKLEELTLYMIEQKKEIDLLKQQNKELKSRLDIITE